MSTLDYLKEAGRKEGVEQGIAQGEERRNFKLVKKHLLANNFTIAQIADFLDVSEDFVLKVKEAINA